MRSQAVRDALLGGVKSLGGGSPVLDDPPPQVIVKDLTQTALVAAIRVWVAPPNAFKAPPAVREKCRESLLAGGVPLAEWRASVGSTLNALEAAGYPGLASTGEGGAGSSKGARPAGSAADDPGEDVAVQAVAVDGL